MGSGTYQAFAKFIIIKNIVANIVCDIGISALLLVIASIE